MARKFWGCSRGVERSATEAQNHHAIGAYDSVSIHHALRACEVGSRKGENVTAFASLQLGFGVTRVRRRRAEVRTVAKLPPEEENTGW